MVGASNHGNGYEYGNADSDTGNAILLSLCPHSSVSRPSLHSPSTAQDFHSFAGGICCKGLADLRPCDHTDLGPKAIPYGSQKKPGPSPRCCLRTWDPEPRNKAHLKASSSIPCCDGRSPPPGAPHRARPPSPSGRVSTPAAPDASNEVRCAVPRPRAPPLASSASRFPSCLPSALPLAAELPSRRVMAVALPVADPSPRGSFVVPASRAPQSPPGSAPQVPQPGHPASSRAGSGTYGSCPHGKSSPELFGWSPRSKYTN